MGSAMTNATISLFRCKYCKVPVIGRYDFRAVLGQVHARRCPRSK